VKRDREGGNRERTNVQRDSRDGRARKGRMIVGGERLVGDERLGKRERALCEGKR